MTTKSTLNLLAAIAFAVAAIAFLIGGTTLLGLLFVVLAVISGYQVIAARSAP